MNNTDFVNGPLTDLVAAYADILHRDPDDSGFLYWARQMAAGLDITKVRVFMANSHDALKLVPEDELPPIVPGLKFGHRRLDDRGPWIVNKVEANKVTYAGAGVDEKSQVISTGSFWSQFYPWPKE